MSEQERVALIDQCILAVLSVRDDVRDRPRDERDAVEAITGAACWQLTLLKDPALRAKYGRVRRA